MGNKSVAPSTSPPQQNTPPAQQNTSTATGIRGLQNSGGGNQMANTVANTNTIKPAINGTILAGGPLTNNTIQAVNEAAKKTPAQWKRYVGYEQIVKVGGSLAWRANNPGNLRDASTKIGTLNGAVGSFAAFATLEDGRTAQRNLYLKTYGAMSVRNAINKLTPPSENNTDAYLSKLEKSGVNLDKDVASQIDLLMAGVEANEGLIAGTEVQRVP
jgi:hypothetical protein